MTLLHVTTAMFATLAAAPQDETETAVRLAPAGRAAQAADDRDGSVEVFDVADLSLASRLRRIAGLLHGLDPTNVQNQTLLRKWEQDESEAPPESVRSKATVYRLLGSLVRSVVTSLDPSASVESHDNGTLVVRGTKKARGAVDATLKSIRAGHDVLSIEMQLLDLDDEGRALVAERSEDEWKKAMSVGAARPADRPDFTTVTQETLDLLVEKKRCNLLAAPTLTVLPLDVAEMRTTEQLNYVADFESIAIEGMGTISDPVVKKLEIGTKVELRAVAATGLFSREPTLFALRVVMEHSVLKRPIATQKTDLGVIQLPEVKTAKIASTLVASAGSRVLLGGVPVPAFDGKEGDRWLYLVVHVREPTNVEDESRKETKPEARPEAKKAKDDGERR
jgi:hypothetical protein